MNFKKAAFLVGLAGFLFATGAQAVDLNWTSKTCVVVDSTFSVCKPSKSWDTQTKSIVDEPVRWVLHRSGANPIIKLLYDTNPRGKTAHDYAKYVKQDLEARQIKISKVENRVINGRNVSILSGQGSDNFGYLVAVYRDGGKGLRLECTASNENFSFFSQEFMASINSVRFVR